MGGGNGAKILVFGHRIASFKKNEYICAEKSMYEFSCAVIAGEFRHEGISRRPFQRLNRSSILR